MYQYRFRERLEHGTPDHPWKLYSLGWSGGTVFPCHWHPEWECLFVERGSLEVTRNQDVSTLGPGEAAFLTGSELHGGTSADPELLVHALVMHPSLFQSDHRDPATVHWIAPLEAGTLRAGEPLKRGSEGARIAGRLVDLVKREPPGVELQLKGLVFELLFDLATRGRIRDEATDPATPFPRIRSLLQYIEEHFAGPLTVDDLARRACLSSSHLSRVFRAITGDSPGQYLIRRRTEEAARLLRDTVEPVSDIAFRVGFSNFSHFSRTFRLAWGCPPTVYRTRMQRPGAE